jgi:predicted nucleic acid-binding protein
MYLIDTNVISELRKTKPHGAVAAWFASVSKEAISIPAVVIGEIQAGVEKTRRLDAAKALEIEQWLEKILIFYTVIPMDASIFREWARLMATKSEILMRDAMIAATARDRRLIVATRNTRDFLQFNVQLLDPFATSV